MRRIFAVPVLILVLGISLSASAQTERGGSSLIASGTSYRKPAGFLDALFNSSRFSMSQSYTMTFGSFGGQTYNQGLYLNTMNFQLADPLFMQVRVGYSHQPFQGLSSMGRQDGRFFLQQAMLQYKPGKNTNITIEYQALPYSVYSPYYRR